MSYGREFVAFTGAHYRLGDSMAHEAAQSSQDSSIIVESSDEEVEQRDEARCPMVIDVIEALEEWSRLSHSAASWMYHVLPNVPHHESTRSFRVAVEEYCEEAIGFSSYLDAIITEHLHGGSVNVHAEMLKAEVTKVKLEIGWDELKAEFDAMKERKDEDEIQQSQDVLHESQDRTWPPLQMNPPRDATKRKRND